ncbi:hypothetical protein AMELA_G00192940 [Ameiurus melas]|uniref:Uncharacterized protein n=1 Tax=Ameiurus melas TaxID=219545 RepID=A0A7J6A6R8_AMEME|nr:hypothetical protein AMELA_G00192940 [Ameiurus melas]
MFTQNSRFRESMHRVDSFLRISSVHMSVFTQLRRTRKARGLREELLKEDIYPLSTVLN